MSELKDIFDEKLALLSAKAKEEGEEALKTWSKSQNSEKVLKLLTEIAELKLKAIRADDDSEDAVFYADRVVKKRLQLAHAIEEEKLLVAATLKEGFLDVLDAGLVIVKEVGKEVLAKAISGAVKGTLSSLKGLA